MIEEVESSELERQTVEQRNQLYSDEMMSLEQELKNLKESNTYFETRIHELNRSIEERDRRILELAQE